jgi:hypothetical protein
MKNVFRIMLIAAAATLFALPAYAQDAAAQPSATAQDADAKNALYTKFLELIKGGPAEQKQASEVGKEYLAKFGTPEDDIVKYIRGWVEKYDAAVWKYEFDQAVANNPARAFEMGRTRLQTQPENVELNLSLVQAGVNAASAKNMAHNAEAANAARRALQLIEGGKTAPNYIIFANRDEAVGGLHYMIGYLLMQSSPVEAAAELIKAAQSNTKFKTEPSTYQYLGGIYYEDFKKQAADYKTKYEGKDETDESRAAFEKLMQTLDRTIDALARAELHSKTAAEKKRFRDQVTALYKSRNNGAETGLNEYLAGVSSRPLPLPDQLAHPALAPSTGAAATTTPPSTTQPSTTQPTSMTTAPATTPAAKPAATPTPNGTKPPTKPRQRR